MRGDAAALQRVDPGQNRVPQLVAFGQRRLALHRLVQPDEFDLVLLDGGTPAKAIRRLTDGGVTAHMRAPVVSDNIHFERRAYDPQIAYAQSKTANSLFAVEATRQRGADRIVASTVYPGGVRTGLRRYFTQAQRESLDAAEAAGVFAYKTTGQGAATTLVAAVAPEFERTGGTTSTTAARRTPCPAARTCPPIPMGEGGVQAGG